MPKKWYWRFFEQKQIGFGFFTHTFIFFHIFVKFGTESSFEIYYDYKNKTVETCRQNGLKILPEVTQELLQDWETYSGV